jgi:hypothetical protein
MFVFNLDLGLLLVKNLGFYNWFLVQREEKLGDEDRAIKYSTQGGVKQEIKPPDNQ